MTGQPGLTILSKKQRHNLKWCYLICAAFSLKLMETQEVMSHRITSHKQGCETKEVKR